MRRLVAAAAISLATAAAAQADEPQKVLTILTAPEPQTQLMAMVLTMNAAQKGAATQILLCGPAGDIALQEAPEGATAPQPPRGASVQGLMRSMMADAGTKVEVCAIYLPGKGMEASALIEGVGVAVPADVAAEIVSDDTQVMSF